MRQKLQATFARASVLLSLTACSGGTHSSIPTPNKANTTALPAQDGDATALGGGNDAGTTPAANVGPGIAPGSSLLNATFDINATSLGIAVCKGDIQMKINAGLKKEDSAKLFEIPEGVVDCGMIGKIDLKQILGSFGQKAPPKLVVKDNVIAFAELGGSTYTPPRPMLPSFISGDKDELAKLAFTKTITLNSAADGKTASGTSRVRMISFNSSYKPPRMDRTFTHVLDFEVVNQGYDGVDKISNMLFDRMEFKISLDPVAILYVSFKGKVADYMEAGKNAGIGGAGGAGGGGPLGGLLGGGSGGGSPTLLGSLTGLIVQGIVKLIDVDMEMTLVKQDGLDAAAGAHDEDDTGEKVGGKSTQE